MATKRYAKANTTMGRNSAISAFKRFLYQRQLSPDSVHELVRNDATGGAFFQFTDRFALHLLTTDGSCGSRLAHGTASLYFGAVKNWMYGLHSGLDQLVERRVHKISTTMDRRFKSRAPVVSKQAPACKKSDLRLMVERILRTASCEDNYWDCVLLVMSGSCSDAVPI